MVHAGLLPRWSIDDAGDSLAKEVETALAGPDYKTFLHELFHGATSQWIRQLNGNGTPGQYRAGVHAAQDHHFATGEISEFSGPPGGRPAGFHALVPHSQSSEQRRDHHHRPLGGFGSAH